MGFFDSKWIVEFEASKGVFSSNKKGTVVVEASSEYSAKDKAKGLLKAEYSYVKILSTHKSGGREEERKTTYKPKSTVTIVEKPQQVDASEPTRRLTPEERESLISEMKQREEIKIQQKNLANVKSKATACKKAEKYHIRITVLSGIVSLIAFLFGWIPHWVFSFQAYASRTQLESWIELGHSETDKTGQEFSADIIKHTSEANSVIWIPFAILGIGIIVTILVFVVVKRKTPIKMEKAKKELDMVLKDYEDKYGKIV